MIEPVQELPTERPRFGEPAVSADSAESLEAAELAEAGEAVESQMI